MYETERRKSGTTKGESGLTATEQKAKQNLLQARGDLRAARALQRKWVTREITFNTASARQWQLLEALWDGSLEEMLAQALEHLGN